MFFFDKFMFKAIFKSHIFGYGFKERISVVLITLGVIGIGFLVGRVLDSYFNQKAIFTVTGVLLSFPFTQYAIYKYLSKITKK